MYRIDVATASATIPTPLAAGIEGYFTNGNPGVGTPATVVDADWANMVQEELYAIVLAAGLTPSKAVRTQVRDGIAALYLAKAGGLLTGALGVIAGTAALPGLYFSGDTNTGIFSPGADQIGQSTAGVERIRIAADGSVSRVIPGGSTLYPDFVSRAWGSFNGTNGTRNADGNISTVTRVSAGVYTVTFATAMPDVNYALSGTANGRTGQADGGATGILNIRYQANNTPNLKTTTQVQLAALDNDGSALIDVNEVCFSIDR
jgi:hypothetical protein